MIEELPSSEKMSPFSEQTVKQFKNQKTEPYLEQQLSNLIEQYKMRGSILSPEAINHLREELYYNYEEANNNFVRTYGAQKKHKTPMRSERRINSNQNRQSVQKNILSASTTLSGVRQKLESDLICSHDLNFLVMYNLSKESYVKELVKTYAIVNELKDFPHFDEIYSLNVDPRLLNQASFSSLIDNIWKEPEELSDIVQNYLRKQKDRIDRIVFKIESHIKKMIDKMK